MLDLDRLDLGMLCMALEDHSPATRWGFDPSTGEAIPGSEDLGWDECDELERERLIVVEPTPSREGYRDMEDFIARVRDPRARELLARAIAGRGAFRRFKDALFDRPELREAWFGFRDARGERRAIAWLRREGLIDVAAAERATAARPDPDPPELAGAFDPHAIAREVSDDLRELYGERLCEVILFGSCARGEADAESDIDLLVVLERVDSGWDELRRMEEILWRHSLAHDTVVSALAVDRGRLNSPVEPTLIRASAEGIAIG